MKIETPPIIWKRTLMLGALLFMVLLLIDRILLESKIEEKKVQLVMDELEVHKVLSNEVHALFYGVQDDFTYFERKVSGLIQEKRQSTEYRSDLRSLIDFFETHEGYFKARVTDSTGQEIFKIVRDSKASFEKSSLLYNLSTQTFYSELNKVKGKDFHFSSMEPNIINGVIEMPLRPTVRVSKRIQLKDNESGLAIFNFDGKKILDLFRHDNFKRWKDTEVALIDTDGFYVASHPLLEDEKYTMKKTTILTKVPDLFKVIKKRTSTQDSISYPDQMIVYSQLILPRTLEKWFLISRIPQQTWEKSVNQERLRWIFWESICFLLVMTWLWRDEKKRLQDEVFMVLLKERSEFMQNVSHQLKTPLAIMYNSLGSDIPNRQEWADLRKELEFLIRVVEDMLLLAQVESFKNIPLKDEDVLDIVSEAVDKVGPKARSKEIQVRFNVDDKLLSSQHRLERPAMVQLLISAIVNLIDNAIDFSPKGEIVDVFVAYVEGRVVIQIKDRGPGIPNEFLPHLFKKFSKGPTGRKGTGLGLSIARKIIELHKGEIVLVNHKGGSIFEIRL